MKQLTTTHLITAILTIVATIATLVESDALTTVACPFVGSTDPR